MTKSGFMTESSVISEHSDASEIFIKMYVYSKNVKYEFSVDLIN